MERRKKPGEPGTYSGHIVEKTSALSGGETKLFLRLSMGDYLIRCSGPGIAEADLLQRVNTHVTLRGEIQSGEMRDLGGNGDYVLVIALVD